VIEKKAEGFRDDLREMIKTFSPGDPDLPYDLRAVLSQEPDIEGEIIEIWGRKLRNAVSSILFPQAVRKSR